MVWSSGTVPSIGSGTSTGAASSGSVPSASVVVVPAGGGVVADSDPTKEYEESINKSRAMAAAIRYAERGLEGL